MRKNAVPDSRNIIEENYDADYVVDRCKTTVNWSMPTMHKHNCCELYFLISGKVQYVIGHSIYSLSDGDIAIVPVDMPHCTLAGDEKRYERLLVYFSENMVNAFRSLAGDEMTEKFIGRGCVRLPDKHRQVFSDVFSELEKEQRRTDEISVLSNTALLWQLITIIMRYGTEVSCDLPENTGNRIADAVYYIQQNYNQSISLVSVANKIGMEPTYFSKVFKKTVGVNFHSYLTSFRLEKVEQMLKTSPNPIELIAEDCGFLSGKYLWTVFKKHYGISPREYRNKMKLQ